MFRRLKSRWFSASTPATSIARELARFGVGTKTQSFAAEVYAKARRDFGGASEVTFRECPICLQQKSIPALAALGKNLAGSLIDASPLRRIGTLPLVYHYCQPCDYFFVSPMPALRFVDYDHATGTGEQRANSWMVDPAYIADKKRSVALHCRISGFESLHRGTAILDVGAGVGVSLEVFRELGFTNLWAIEPDSFSVGVMRSDRPWIKSFHGDIYSVDIGQQVDLVMFDNVLEHQTRPRQAVLAALAMLRPGGKLWASVPNASGMDFRENQMRSRNLNFGHWSYFTRRALSELLAGCSDVRFYDSVGFFDAHDNAEDWINVLAIKPIHSA